MLEEKISNLKNIVVIKLTFFILLLVALFWVLSEANHNYLTAKAKIRDAHTALSEMQLKLSEIKDSGTSIAEGIAKYKEIALITEQARCAEYMKKIQQISKLKSKYNLASNIRTILSELPIKSNLLRNKATHIVSYDLKIEFDSYSIDQAFNILLDIMSILPQFTMSYLVDINEMEAITPQNVMTLHPNTTPSLIHARLYVKMQDVALNQVGN